MDRSLLKEREAFKKRALATPTVENKVRKPESSGRSSGGGSAGKMKPPPEINYKAMSSHNSSQYKFGVLARIVRHMRSRHQEGETHALTLQEILDETNQLNVGQKNQQWLQFESLPSNPKVCESDGGWVFSPPLPVRDRKGLLKLLKTNDLRGFGGILMEDIQESVPQSGKVIKMLTKDVLIVTRATDKKQVVFYHDHGLDYIVEDDFKQLWRNTSVDGMHDDNIDEYLNKQGIKSMEDVARAFRPAFRRKAKARRSQPTKITDNDHMAHVLQNYELP